jgi:signal transduction histidine kinase
MRRPAALAQVEPGTKLGAFASRHAMDAVIVVIVVVGIVESLTGGVEAPKLDAVAVALLATLPLLLRRLYPFVAPAFVFAVIAALSVARPEAVQDGPDMTLLAPFLAFWVVGAYNERPQAVAGIAIGVAALAVTAGGDFVVETGESDLDVLTGSLLGIGVSLAAFALRRRARRAADFEDRATRVMRERAERERAAVAEERARIARDLHDVVAHSVSVIVVQATAAEEVLGRDSERARAPLRAIQETATQALTEMRRLLGILRADERELALGRQPGLGSLEALAGEFRDAGLPVEVAVEGERRMLPPGVDLAAYRIVEEALTNSLKYSGRASTRVRVRHANGAIELEVTDDGPGPSVGEGGHGLVGMRERAALYGGTLEVGAGDGGGFAVRARLPLASDAPMPQGGE